MQETAKLSEFSAKISKTEFWVAAYVVWSRSYPCSKSMANNCLQPSLNGRSPYNIQQRNGSVTREQWTSTKNCYIHRTLINSLIVYLWYSYLVIFTSNCKESNNKKHQDVNIKNCLFSVPIHRCLTLNYIFSTFVMHWIFDSFADKAKIKYINEINLARLYTST